MAVAVVGRVRRRLVAGRVTPFDELAYGQRIFVGVHVARDENRAAVLVFQHFGFGHHQTYLCRTRVGTARLRGFALPPQVGVDHGEEPARVLLAEDRRGVGFAADVAPARRGVEDVVDVHQLHGFGVIEDRRVVPRLLALVGDPIAVSADQRVEPLVHVEAVFLQIEHVGHEGAHELGELRSTHVVAGIFADEAPCFGNVVAAVIPDVVGQDAQVRTRSACEEAFALDRAFDMRVARNVALPEHLRDMLRGLRQGPVAAAVDQEIAARDADGVVEGRPILRPDEPDGPAPAERRVGQYPQFGLFGAGEFLSERPRGIDALLVFECGAVDDREVRRARSCDFALRAGLQAEGGEQKDREDKSFFHLISKICRFAKIYTEITSNGRAPLLLWVRSLFVGWDSAAFAILFPPRHSPN